MNRTKTVKGQYGYMKKQKQKVTVWTILMFAVSLSLLLAGIWSTGSKKNLLTVVAILGCLPASKSAVNMIMFLKAKGCSEAAKQKLEACTIPFLQLYDLLFTSYEKNYQVSHMIVAGNVVCGYSEDVKCEEKACEKHLDNLLKKGGLKGVTVKIYKDLNQYCEGIHNLSIQKNAEEGKNNGESGQMEEIVRNLLDVSL